jgi:hypothetical protein
MATRRWPTFAISTRAASSASLAKKPLTLCVERHAGRAAVNAPCPTICLPSLAGGSLAFLSNGVGAPGPPRALALRQLASLAQLSGALSLPQHCLLGQVLPFGITPQRCVGGNGTQGQRDGQRQRGVRGYGCERQTGKPSNEEEEGGGAGAAGIRFTAWFRLVGTRSRHDTDASATKL